MSGAWRILLELSVRSLFAHRTKSLIVGSLMLFGTLLVVVGTSLLDTVEASMARSITSSLAGHLQLYSSKAKDPLALFGGVMLAKEELGRMDDFEAVKKVAAAVPNVAAVVPMGIEFATVTSGNETDELGTALREAHAKGDAARVEAIVGQLRALAADLERERGEQLKISAKPEQVRAELATIARAQDPALWAQLPSDPEAVFQFVETQLAPLSADGLLYYFRYIGTDTEQFRRRFDTFKLVKGEPIPAGRRGFMFADHYYEQVIKHKVARDLDRLAEQVSRNGAAIADDPILANLARQIPKQQRRILVQLDPKERAALSERLGVLLPETRELPLDRQLSAFLTVSDANVVERHRIFYETIAPMIELYQVKVGDVITIRAFSQSGYLTAVNVKLYGTFAFEGLERSDLAGSVSITDMQTFRDLYGLMSPERRAEVEALRAKVGVRDIDRGSVEDALFGEPSELEVEATKAQGFDELAGAELRGRDKRLDELLAETFDQSAIDRGVALNAAVILEDPSRLEESRAALAKALADAGLEVQVVDWQTASGIVGQFIYVLRGVLYVAIFVIFLVTIVILNNSMIMATMDRVQEIGTMRAIGAQRSTVTLMVFTETVILGLVAGGVGAALGAGVVSWLGVVGIPAGTTDVLVLLFAGPRLYPSFGVSNLVIGLVVILLVSLVSTLYPARIAARVQPVVAMQAKD